MGVLFLVLGIVFILVYEFNIPTNTIIISSVVWALHLTLNIIYYVISYFIKVIIAKIKYHNITSVV